MAGFDTGGTVQEVESAAVTEFGSPAFWIRYFSPCYLTPVNSSATNAVDECKAIWNSGGHYLGAVSTPLQSRLSGTKADGTADAQTFANALQTVYYDVSTLKLPSNNELYCWLDQETNTTLSVDYWDGWASYLDGFNFANTGTLPLYPALYCNPCAAVANCSTLKSASYAAFGIWASEPQECKYTLTNTPPWAPETCAGCGVDNGVATEIWQYADNLVCSFTADVDLDLGAPGTLVANYCFDVSAKPS
jgi:hypothetical protein